ncbi:sll0787 family AIR synthase-like protein [Bradyrhizobium sp. dw_78]|uniref:sll0787 family AIR synthase-like protein n=1 Tax=Bradyrhizobium sp. dw_78 TaxID=2719793 RepID=UPI001BD350D1|nr:sll0787 family AIR synthase-like protein [Bradyrhizobium sp. dw_78]
MMPGQFAITALAERLRRSGGIAAKGDIALVATSLGLSGDDVIAVGDDCAAIPDGDGYLLFAIEGFMNEFVAGDPWFAGWCGAMVNISDIAAMGGRPIAIVNAIWANGEANAAPVLKGLKEAAKAYHVPVVGGHTNIRTDRGQLSVAILGRAKKLLTSFDAEPGDELIAAVDLRGRYREPFSNWEAATEAPPARLRGDLELLPMIAEAALCRAAKDISQGGIVGTAAMLAECSGVAIDIDLRSIPKPAGAPLERWLLTFPSFGYLLSVKPGNAAETIACFAGRGIAAARIGAVSRGSRVSIGDGTSSETIWDFAQKPLIGAGRSRTPSTMEAVA